MMEASAPRTGSAQTGVALVLLLLGLAVALATDWPQYRGPTTDGISPDPLAATWATNSPGFVVWTNMSLTNGFSSFAVSQGRAFALISKDDGSGSLLVYCVAVDAATGANLWATPIDSAPWDPNVTYNGGDGIAPYNTGDGPRTTPAVAGGRVFALSGLMHLVCLNATNGSVAWSNNLPVSYGATTITWENAASPCLDSDLVFVSLNSSTNNRNLVAFRTADGSPAWSSQNENVTHTTPAVATIQGLRQVIFATQTGLVSLDRTTGALLWKFTYPFGSIGTSMGASPVVYSNIVYCTASYGKGAAAAQITLSNSTWTVTQLFYKTGPIYRSIWMSPVCYQGFIYTLAGDNSTFLAPPLNCIELSTGNLMWTTNSFGMGGLILVNTNLLVLTEKGQLVLVQPNPDAYVELARYQAFQFSAGAPGKCWNSPAFSNGRIYARSTRGGICLDVSVPTLPPLKLLAPQFLNSTQLQLVVSTANGTPIDSNRLARIEVRATNSPGIPPSAWPKLTNALVLTTNGLARLTNTIPTGQSRQVFITVEPP
jgi:outer membrane protein assembly factor BamB